MIQQNYKGWPKFATGFLSWLTSTRDGLRLCERACGTSSWQGESGRGGEGFTWHVAGIPSSAWCFPFAFLPVAGVFYGTNSEFVLRFGGFLHCSWRMQVNSPVKGASFCTCESTTNERLAKWDFLGRRIIEPSKPALTFAYFCSLVLSRSKARTS